MRNSLSKVRDGRGRETVIRFPGYQMSLENCPKERDIPN